MLCMKVLGLSFRQFSLSLRRLSLSFLAQPLKEKGQLLRIYEDMPCSKSSEKSTTDKSKNRRQSREVEIVLTAHPTQINQRTLQYKHIRIDHLLDFKGRPDLTNEDKDMLIRDLVREITSIWQTYELRHPKPRPVDEARADELLELRRRADQALIYSLAFSSPAQWLAVSSEKDIVHVFSLKVDSRSLGNDRLHSTSEFNVPNSSCISSLSFMKSVLPKYFSSEWLVAIYHLHEGLQCIVGFGQQKNIVKILGMAGRNDM